MNPGGRLHQKVTSVMGLELRVSCCKTENRKFFKAEGIEYGMVQKGTDLCQERTMSSYCP